MKKNVALFILALLVIIFWAKSCTAKNSNSLKLLQLQNKVAALETENNELKSSAIDSQRTIDFLQSKIDKFNNENRIVSNTESETSDSDALEESAISAYLSNLIKHGSTESLLKVAESNYATENHLVAVASKTSQLNYIFNENAIKIAEALSKNPATTTKVMLELSNSNSSIVQDIAQQYIESHIE